MKKALVVGIDHYPSPNRLNGCVNDALSLSEMLEKNEDGSPNFDLRRLTSKDSSVDTGSLFDAICELFTGDAEIALLYFAGHGILNQVTNAGYLVTPDGTKPNWGVNLSDVLEQANKAHPRIKSTVILLDSCRSGFAGELSGLGKKGIDVIGNGVTIMAACHKDGVAVEEDGYGKFTDIMLDGLGGAASDVLGRITPASLYAHADQTLGAWEQRPVYKANVHTFITLRLVKPKVPKEILRQLPVYFPKPDSIFPLDPSYEEDRGEETERLKDIPTDENKVRIYRDLQKCNRHGLVVPSEHEHMWHSAVFSGGCRLTATGIYIRRLAERGRI